MSDDHDPVALLPYTFSTWVYTLHVSGVQADDAAVTEACEAISAAPDEDIGDAAGEVLVARVRDLLGDREGDGVIALAASLYGSRASAGLGEGDRDDRTGRIRAYQFGRSLPWLARIFERHGDGQIGPSWLLVERVTDFVHAMDPNPWNDIDEARAVPIGDFHVLWELDGCTHVHIA